MAQFLSQFQNPRYTGSNRCWKCTVLNTTLAAIMAGLLATANALVGVLAFAISLASIYFRGYLVPGTPRLTKRYLPSNVLSWFGHTVTRRADGRGQSIESILLDAGAVHEGDDDLYIDPDFQSAWRSQIHDLRDTPDMDRLRAIGGLPPAQLDQATVVTSGEGVLAMVDSVQIAHWDSEGVFLADAAAARELQHRYPGWGDLHFDERTQVLGGLRLWLEWCPLCDGRVALHQETVETCCDTVEVVVGSCEDCGRRLFELRASAKQLQ